MRPTAIDPNGSRCEYQEDPTPRETLQTNAPEEQKRVDSLYQLDPDADADEAYTSAYRLPTAPALAKPDDSWPYCDACGYAGFALPPSRYCPCPWDTRDTAQNARSTP